MIKISKKIYPPLYIPRIDRKYAKPNEKYIYDKIKLPNGKQLYKASTIMRAKPPHKNNIALPKQSLIHPPIAPIKNMRYE